MKKTVGILLVFLLLFSFSAPAFAAVEDTSGGVWNAVFSGYTVPIPEAYRTAAGFIHFLDFGGDLEFEGTGVMCSRIYYTAMTKEDRQAAVEKIDTAYLMDEWDLVADLEMEFEKKEINLFTIYVTANPWEPEKLHAFLREKALAGAKDRKDEAEEDYLTRAWESMRFLEIGEKDGFRYYLTSFAPELLRERYAETVEESYLTECLALLEQPELITDNLTLTKPAG